MSRDLSPAPVLRLESLEVAFVHQGGSKHAVRNLSFDVRAGEVIAILGPSGCGKSSILNTIAGFILPSSGALQFSPAIPWTPGAIAMAFQDVGLFPWLTALDNTALRLRYTGISRSERASIARAMLDSVGLQEDTGKFPHELSGGMKQRVGIARALLGDPHLLLLDEPFAALDSVTRVHMQELLLALLQTRAPTVILVTHDVSEAIFLADRIVVLEGTPGCLRKIIPVTPEGPRDRTFMLSQQFGSLRSEILQLIL